MVATAFGIAALVFLLLAVLGALNVVAVQVVLMVVLAVVCAVVFAVLRGGLSGRSP